MEFSVRQARFLAAYAECASIKVACRWAHVTPSAHYQWLENDPEYPAKFRKAGERAARVYRDEATRRAVQGIRKAVRYKGKVIAWDTEYSDSLMLAFLKATAPEEFKERSEQRVVSDQSVSIGQLTLIQNKIMGALDGLPEEARQKVAQALLEVPVDAAEPTE
jgi:hypothetical protein